MELTVVAELGTALGTVALALATYASVRSANSAARTAERSMLQGLRPLLFPSRLTDDPVKVLFMDQYVVRVPGGQGAVEVTDEACYLAMSLRNVGHGVAVLDRYLVEPGLTSSTARSDHASLDRFQRLTRDLYIPPGDVFFWQAAFRDPAEPDFAEIARALREETPLTVELLYGDEEGAQHTITRYSLLPHRSEDGGLVWLTNVSRHWNIDGP
ncbi:hypothetical protein, partial [Nocardioides sp.]|uniref:hypothetical protein n=1 Tax=Nocardioides sp. TaxID=35761 RepID=UPI0031FEBA37|nr:hypothetical protein [Nocardioides sp.]